MKNVYLYEDDSGRLTLEWDGWAFQGMDYTQSTFKQDAESIEEWHSDHSAKSPIKEVGELGRLIAIYDPKDENLHIGRPWSVAAQRYLGAKEEDPPEAGDGAAS